MLLEFLRAANIQNLVRIDRTFGKLLAFFHIIAFEDNNVFADRNEVLFFNSGLLVFDDDAAFPAHARAEINDAVDFGNFGGVFGPAGLEELGDARQAAGDVLGLGSFARGSGHECAGDDVIAFSDDDMGAGRNGIVGGGFAFIIEDDDLRVQIFFMLDDDHGFLLRLLIHFLFHGDALDDIEELHAA